MESEQTQQDDINAKYFKDGWEKALKEVLVIEKKHGPESAIQWVKNELTPSIGI